MRIIEEQILNSMIQQGAFARTLFVDAVYYAKRMSSVKNNIKKLLKNQQVIEEQAKAFSSLSRDLSDVKQKSWETGMRNKNIILNYLSRMQVSQ